MKVLAQLLVTAAWLYCAGLMVAQAMAALRGYFAVGGEIFLLAAFGVFCWQLTGCLWEKVNNLL